MKITMLEPLDVPKEVVEKLSKKLIEDKHEFTPCYHRLSEEEKLTRIKDADIIVITNGKLPEEYVNQAEKLKLISVGFTGIDHIPAKVCADRHIVVCNSQGYATIPTAELAVSLMLMATRNIIQTEQRCRNGETKAGLVGMELSGKTVGIVGTGMIGRHVAKLLKGFDTHLLGYDVYESDEAKALGIKYVSLEEIFVKSDFISLHLPLFEETKGIIDENLIAKMKRDAILVNCARGPILKTEALVNALNEGKIRGAGVDVYEIEPPLSKDHLVFSAKNLVTTPHIAFASKESMERRASIVFDNVYSYLNGIPQNVIKLS